MIPKSSRQKRQEAKRGQDFRPSRLTRREAPKAERTIKVHKANLRDGKFGEWVEAPTDAAVSPATRFKKPRPTTTKLRLTAEQRKEIFHGGHPRLAFRRFTPKAGKPKGCPVKAGEWVTLSSQVSLGIEGITKTTTEYVLVYRVIDTRARLLRASVHHTDFEAWRRDNERRRSLDLDGIEAGIAAEESGYTTSPIAALAREPEAIGKEEQDKMSRELAELDLNELEEQRNAMTSLLDEMKGSPTFADVGSELAFVRKRLEGVIEKVETRIRIRAGKEAA